MSSQPSQPARDLALIAVFAGVTAALGLIPPLYVPISPVPITAQSLGPMLAGAILGGRRGAFSQLLFLALVALGLPLLSGGRGGLGVFFGPSWGFIVGFVVCAWFVGWATYRVGAPYSVWKGLIITVIGGLVIMYALGIPGLMISGKLTFSQALIGNPKLVIVDEPTAGLDPEERVRFHNLLADIASDVVVILSTHIVSDVEDLCAQFAVINKGQVLLSGRPAEYVASLEGRMWSRATTKSETEAIRQQARVVSTRLAAGRTVVRAYGEASPGAGFEAVAPDLEDVYFCTIAGYLTPKAVAA